MERYFWDENTMRKSLNTLLQLMNDESDPLKRLKLEENYDLNNGSIFKWFMTPEIKPQPLSQRIYELYQDYLCDQRYFSVSDVYDNALEKNLSLFAEASDNKDLLHYTKAKVSKDRALSICHDFFASFDDELYGYFKPFYDKRFNHVRFFPAKKNVTNLTRGQAFYLYGLDDGYIEIMNSGDPDMAISTIHESTHIVDFRYNPKAYLENGYFTEVSSLFMELVALYERVGNFDELFYHINIVERLSSNFLDAINCSNLSMLLSHFKENGYKINYKFYKRVIGDKFSIKEIRDTLTESVLNDSVYPISCTLALYFFNMYKQDKRKCLVEFKKFLAAKDRDDYIPLILSDEFASTINGEVKDILTTSNEAFVKSLGKKA